MTLKVGDKAPSFSLPDADRKARTLSEFLGKKTIIASIPGAFTSVCTAELCTFRDMLADLSTLGAQVVVLDVDSPFVNRAYADANQVTFPILSDYTRATVKAYGGVHDDFAGLTGYTAPKRSVFVLDAEGVVRYAWISENPGASPLFEEIKQALSEMR